MGTFACCALAVEFLRENRDLRSGLAAWRQNPPHSEQSMQRFFGTVFSRPIVVGALRVSVVVGCVLNLINQGDAIFSGGDIAWVHVALNFLVPYAVSSYSAARNQLSNRTPK
ncbi:MAG: nitrate/nitrite transporter NrtS [Hydrogenophaga sp.]|jgi:hypothetical protein|nr:nitrate/nitrite transporter NrtS [Hydrogenophaga sp.]